MIKLDVQEYCCECYEFDPAVKRPEKLYLNDGTVYLTDTIVSCSNAKRCESIKRYLFNQCNKHSGK